MEKHYQLSENIVFYIEESKEEKFGILRNFFTNDKAYTNHDMVKILLHLFSGKSINSFFPEDLPDRLRETILIQSQKNLQQLIRRGFLAQSSNKRKGRIKYVSTQPPLRVLFIEMTKRCNLLCKHCYVDDSSKFSSRNQFNSRELEGLIFQADELGVMEVQLTGGEPFMLSYTTSIIEKLQHLLLPCSVFTNATMLTEEFLEHVKTMPYGIIFYISLHGPEEIHDDFCRVEGSYQKAMSAINRLLKVGCDVRINTAVGTHNFAYMDEFIEFVENIGVTHQLVMIESLGRAARNKDLLISDKEFADLLKRHGGNIQFLDSHDESPFRDWTTPACGIGSAMLFIDALGNVSLCPMMTQDQSPTFLAGNIRERKIKEIWENSTVFSRFRSIQCREIKSCQFRELCAGGCRSKAYLATSDINAPDKTMCYLYGRKF